MVEFMDLIISLQAPKTLRFLPVHALDVDIRNT